MLGTLAWDFYCQQARQAQHSVGPAGVAARHWRWDGVLTEYVFAPGADGGADGGTLGNGVGSGVGNENTPASTVHTPSSRPAILLVHGFGAFAEQWRGQVLPLARAGYDVYAATFPGYGRAGR